MTSYFRTGLLIPCIATLLLSGCAATSASDSSTAAPKTKSSYTNFLVIGVAGDYNSRAQFERTVVSQLRQHGASATTYYSIVGGNKPVAADDVRAAVASGNFDAILVTRVVSKETELEVQKSRTATVATPIGDRFVNLFRFDYTDYSDPGSVDLKTSATFASDLYDAENEEIVWSTEFAKKGETNVGALIDETASTVVDRVRRDGLIAR